MCRIGNSLVKISKMVFTSIILVCSCSFLQMSHADTYDKVYWEEQICLGYSVREWGVLDSIACFRARASFLDSLIKKISFWYDRQSLKYSWNLDKKLREEFGLECELNDCINVSDDDYEILSNLENMRDAYSTIIFSLESSRNRHYSI